MENIDYTKCGTPRAEALYVNSLKEKVTALDGKVDPLQEETQVGAAWDACNKQYDTWTQELPLCDNCS